MPALTDFHRASRAYTLTLSAGVASAETSSSALGTNNLRLVSTVDCWVSTDRLATPAVGTGILLPAKVPMFLRATPGEIISAVADTTAGKLNITEMTR